MNSNSNLRRERQCVRYLMIEGVRLGCLGVLLGLNPLNQTLGGVWQEKSSMATARLGLASAVVNGKIYVVGGYAAANSPGLRVVEEYDPETDTWTTKAPLPTGRRWLSATALNGKIYVTGGFQNAGWSELPIMEVYDPATDTWTRKADMPTPKKGLASCALDGKLYVVGNTPPYNRTAFEVYDPASDTWAVKPDLPGAPRAMTGMSAWNGLIYVIGGLAGSPAAPQRAHYVYDPLIEAWSPIAPMPTPRLGISTSVVDGEIYAMGGITRQGGQTLSTVEVYHPDTDSWTADREIPYALWALSTSVVNGKIYAVGGAETATGGHAGGRRLFELDVNPLVVDFNLDLWVDTEDVTLMIDHWQTANPIYDIAPRPFGDGIVNAEDLCLLAEHLFEEHLPVELIAYWKLDEREGDIAYDSTGQHDADCTAFPLWEPDGGIAGGALRLDGVDDVLVAGPILDPEDGPFSLFAWVKGGAPGQVILSQAQGANWLMADGLDGTLMTEIADPVKRFRTQSSGGEPLTSPAAITDGHWHRVGFVWDGVNRILYLDDVEVARDSIDELASGRGKIHIGAGKGLVAGSFWSGLIDDVRIYDRPVTP